MYIPSANAETRVPVMHQMMRAHPLAALVTLTSAGLLASHIPVVLHEDGSEFGLLRGHVARGNPQWSDLDDATDALAIFSGPQHYISPSWYPGKREHGREVPTWNYVVVHAYGPLTIHRETGWLMRHLQTLTDTSEREREAPWAISDAPAGYIEGVSRGIVGLELPIRRLEGKWKVSQNRTDADRAGVIAGLTELDTPEARTMRELVAGPR